MQRAVGGKKQGHSAGSKGPFGSRRMAGFVAMDREVMPMAWAGTGDFANTSPLLIDLRRMIPPDCAEVIDSVSVNDSEEVILSYPAQ